jgi:hypothetical protein
MRVGGGGAVHLSASAVLCGTVCSRKDAWARAEGEWAARVGCVSTRHAGGTQGRGREKINSIFIELYYSQRTCTAIRLCVEYMQAPVSRCASSTEALGDGFNRSPGFWLRDGGAARRYRSKVWTGCGV